MKEGGRRVTDQSKAWEKGKPIISIITVVYNCHDEMKATLESIALLDWPNIEHIVVDGGSTDRTIMLLEQNNNEIEYWVSEPDNGLYDAMNKAMRLATGDYLWFINSGDHPYNDGVLRAVFSGSETEADMYYGDTEIIANDGSSIGMRRLRPPEKLTWKSLKKGMLICHQSILVRRELCPEFDTSLKLAADFDWLMRILRNSKKIVNTRLIITKFLDGGLSKKKIRLALKERFLVMKRNYGWLPTVIAHIPIVFRFVLFFVKNRRF
ncbi:MAG: glycosyltransferase [Bacteroidetes bacterium]|nr:glycosyltransferase [Bacteroidota bacterium]MBU1719604.1 glycosyltransferase [Bacteroidota bacterium]